MGFKLLVLLFVRTSVFLLLWCSCMSLAHSNVTDRLALLAFKAGITQDPSHVLSSWNESIPHCKWQGVICSGRLHPHRVLEVNLRSRGLEGVMTPEIGNLSFLQGIDLENNSFHGEIPHQVNFLSGLNLLNLNNNSFEGKIPSNMSHCSNLVRLNLDNNYIEGEIPVELGSLPMLEFLSFHQNKLTGHIPPSLGNLSYLKHLGARNNGLRGSIPDSLGQLRSLEILALGGNNLSGVIPSSIYNLSLLQRLDFGINQLEGSLPQNLGVNLLNLQWVSFAVNQFYGQIPISLSNLSKVEQLFLGVNNFTGKVAIHFGGLSKLTRLSMDRNHLGGGEADDLSFIKTLTNCSRLQELWLQRNRFGGLLPSTISNLSAHLRMFSLARNQISGSIPAGIENLVSLLHLNLSRNLLEGSIPKSIGRLHMLNELDLGENRFTGSIPPLGNLTQLIELFLYGNHLHGSISSSLKNCNKLLHLNLADNILDGVVPKEVFDSSGLIELWLGRNQLIGSLPPEVGQLTHLGILDVSENMLSGAIPGTLGACTSLESLFMEGNLFQGSLPTSLEYLRSLQDLDASRNNFSGIIPKYLAKFEFFRNLNLSFNHLEGEVPVEGAFGNLSIVCLIGNYKLCGGIPELHLTSCHTRGGRSHIFKLIAIICSCGVSLSLMFMILFFILFLKRKERKESTTFFMEDGHFRISYAQLLKATNGFSSANLIGVGSYSSVYQGILNPGEIIVAVKVLNIEQRNASKSFLAECEVLRNVRHRNLVRILTSCSSLDNEGNNFMALIYEFMPGGNLDRWLHPDENGMQGLQRPLKLITRLNIAIDIGAALDYLHHHCHMQIIHCDIKPSNVLLNDDLIAHLGDFGISRILSKVSGANQNQTGSLGIKGSIGYIAPEFAVGADVSTYNDVYSYGILLLEMFTSKRPTDEMFKDNLNIHCWAEMALHDDVTTIIDPALLTMEGEQEVQAETIANTTKSQRCMRDRLQECFYLVIKIGVACSAKSPWNRMDMKDVMRELHLIKDIYLGIASG